MIQYTTTTTNDNNDHDNKHNKYNKHTDIIKQAIIGLVSNVASSSR